MLSDMLIEIFIFIFFYTCETEYGSYKVEAKTKTANGAEFTTNGSSEHETGRFVGNLETKYNWKDYGMYF